MNVETIKKNLIKYASRAYPILIDELGLPSYVMINKEKFILKCSIDRHRFRQAMTSDLVGNHFFSTEEASKISDLYCEEKYNEFKIAVMQL